MFYFSFDSSIGEKLVKVYQLYHETVSGAPVLRVVARSGDDLLKNLPHAQVLTPRAVSRAIVSTICNHFVALFQSGAGEGDSIDSQEK